MTIDPNDYRLADFKVLLPLRVDTRTLVIDVADARFLPHLLGELGPVDTVGVVPGAPADVGIARSANPVQEVSEPRGLYDLVLSDSLSAARHLRPGGTLCQFIHGSSREPAAPIPGLTCIGRWRAFPSWPDFRVLIPEHAAAWKAAMRCLRLLPLRSWSGLLAWLFPASSSNRLPRRGIALHRLAATAAQRMFTPLQAAETALAAGVQERKQTAFSLTDWILVSGRLGPGNPILAFQTDDTGHLSRLIKLARYPEAEHLALEARKLQDLENALGPERSTRVIRPTAFARIAGGLSDSGVRSEPNGRTKTIDHDGEAYGDSSAREWREKGAELPTAGAGEGTGAAGAQQAAGRAALAYDYVPTYPFFGLRWRMQARRLFCLAITRWLTDIASATRRDEHGEACEQRHRLPLRRLVARNILPAPMQSEARRALEWLNRQPSLPTVFEHGDLGVYNVRMIRRDGRDFQVLDWGSSTFQGIAVGDLAYLLSSARASAKLGATCIRRYLRGLSLPDEAAAPLWFTYLARRWEELDTVRTPVDGDPGSGGGVLLAVHAQVRPLLNHLVDPAAICTDCKE